MEEKNPLVSIIVRTKDRPKLLKTALQSISAQTYRPIEVVLVNDGGCDLDVEEIRRILGDITLNYLRLEKNMGRAHAGNIGIKNSKGKYVGFLDDDDELYPEHIITLASFLGQSDYKVAYTDTEMFYKDFFADERKMGNVDKVIFSRDFSFNELLVGNYIPFNSILFSKDILIFTGEFDENFELYEDWDFLIRIGQKYPFYHIKKITTIYNQWSKDLQINQANSKHMRAMHLKVIGKHHEKIIPEFILDMRYEKEKALSDLKNQTDVNNVLGKDLEESRKEINEKNDSILRLEESGKEKDKHILQLGESARELAREKDRQILKLENDLYLMRNTSGWKILEKMRRFREKVLPHDSRRRKIYNLGIKGLKVLKKEGLRNFVSKIKQKFKFHKQSQLLMNSAYMSIKEDLKTLPLDIILPIYNGYDYIPQCIDSVLRHTDLQFHSLILIDDKSTDDRIKDYLKQIDIRDKNIEILFNEANIGFVKTVNKGMKHFRRDIILLNSDTIVTKGWAEKMQRAAYSKPRVATVTPFSNNATHCSIPEFLKENSIPDGYDIDSFAQFIEDISLRYYPEIPTAVGFCMYLKRAVIEKIGYFDELNFDKGYGEECEFCARANRSGFINVLDDSTFVYHKGSVSFTTDKRAEIVDKHLDIIDGMYPEFLEKVNKFYNQNPLGLIHNYIRFRMSLR